MIINNAVRMRSGSPYAGHYGAYGASFLTNLVEGAKSAVQNVAQDVGRATGILPPKPAAPVAQPAAPATVPAFAPISPINFRPPMMVATVAKSPISLGLLAGAGLLLAGAFYMKSQKRSRR